MTDRPQSPLLNWRWWVALPLTVAIAMLATILIAIKSAGEIAEYYGDILQINTLRPLIRWTWGGRYDD